MAVGDITFTVVGNFGADEAALKTAMDALSTGAVKAGEDTTTYHFVPINGRVVVYKIVRAAA